MTKAELIKHCQSGDKKAMEELYKMYSGRMISIIRKYIADAQAAQDILHDGFIIIFTHISDIKDSDKIEYWMGTIMKNLSIQYLSQLDVFDTIDNNFDIADTPDITDILTCDELYAIINRLPDGYKTIFRLSVLEEKSHKEISKILGISPSTSTSQLFHAKVLLRKLIREHLRGLLVLIVLLVAFLSVFFNDKEVTSNFKKQAIATSTEANDSTDTSTHKMPIVAHGKPKMPTMIDSTSYNTGITANDTIENKPDITIQDTVNNDTTAQSDTIIAPPFENFDMENHFENTIKIATRNDNDKWRITIAYSPYGNANNRFSTMLNMGSGGIGSQDDEIKAKYRFGMPLSFGIGLEREINTRLSINSGLNIMLTNCTIEYQAHDLNATRDLRTHFIGISLGCNYDLFDFNSSAIYVPAKIGIDLPVGTHTRTDNPYMLVLPDAKSPSTRFYITLGAGFEYNVYRNIHLYVEPSLKYNFNGASNPQSDGQRKLDFYVPIGIKFSW